MKNWKAAVLSVGVGLFTGILIPVSAFAGTHVFSTESENQITTGDVSISLSEYEWNEDGEEIAYRDGKQVLPGQRLSKIVRITNEAQEAWIRAKIEYASDLSGEILNDECLGGITAEWKKIGDYYYYTKPLEEGASVELFREIQIPAEWDQTVSEQEFGLTITAQAIQAAHMVPDFFGEAPWFGIPVEACIHQEHTQKKESGTGSFEIWFENGAEGFVKDSSDFFEDFAAMMPGDTMTGTLEFGSQFQRKLDISFWSELPEGQSEDVLQLLQELQLTISDEEQILYEGKLWEERLKDKRTLVQGLKKGESQKVTYRLYMPETLQNASAMKAAKVKWIFSVTYGSSGGGRGSGSGSYSYTSERKGESMILPQMEQTVQQFAEYLEKLPGTGDERNGYLFLVMLISGGAAFFLSSGEKKQRRNVNKGILLLGSAVLLGVGGTWAYFSYGRIADNAFQVGKNEIKIQEDYEPPKELTVGENLFRKRVQVKNTGTVSCFVRIFADFSDYIVKERSQISPDGTEYYPAKEYAEHLPEPWVYIAPEEDELLGGFYYYAVPLAKKETTIPLFEKVKCSFQDAEEVREFDIIVSAESVQIYDKDGVVLDGADGYRAAWQEYLERR